MKFNEQVFEEEIEKFAADLKKNHKPLDVDSKVYRASFKDCIKLIKIALRSFKKSA